jgi:hypothetical protein
VQGGRHPSGRHFSTLPTGTDWNSCDFRPKHEPLAGSRSWVPRRKRQKSLESETIFFAGRLGLEGKTGLEGIRQKVVREAGNDAEYFHDSLSNGQSHSSARRGGPSLGLDSGGTQRPDIREGRTSEFPLKRLTSSRKPLERQIKVSQTTNFLPICQAVGGRESRHSGRFLMIESCD